MNTNTTIQRIESANSVPSADTLPIGTWSADDLLTRIDERSRPMTDLKPTPTRQPDPGKPSRWRGPAIALGELTGLWIYVLGPIVGAVID